MNALQLQVPQGVEEAAPVALEETHSHIHQGHSLGLNVVAAGAGVFRIQGCALQSVICLQRNSEIEVAQRSMEALESLFSVTKLPPRARRKAKDGAPAAASDASAGILEARRSQNVCISLARLKIGIVGIVNAVISADLEAPHPFLAAPSPICSAY